MHTWLHNVVVDDMGEKTLFKKLHLDIEYQATILDTAAILDSIINLTNCL